MSNVSMELLVLISNTFISLELQIFSLYISKFYFVFYWLNSTKKKMEHAFKSIKYDR